MEIKYENGVILKCLGGFYYIDIGDEIIECRARGLFRKESIKPIVGDKCRIRLTNEDKTKGYIEEIYERKNIITRPPVANIDQAIIVFSIKNPNPNFRLLDKFLIQSELNNINSIICINKTDLDSVAAIDFKNIYEKAGYEVVLTNKSDIETINELKNKLKNRLSVFAGPSGVGKSTLLNLIENGLNLKTGEISKKLNRGKHTTRHAEIYTLSFSGWVVDTAGFSSLNLSGVTKDNLKDYFIEFSDFNNCRYATCNHYKEPNCYVKEAVLDGEISKERYECYISFLEELIKGEKI